MDLLTLLSVCSLGFDPKLMQGIAVVQSGGAPYTYKIGEDIVRFDDVQDAILSARALQKEGKKIRIGLMGLDIDLLAATAQPNEAMFEPCVNVNIASRTLMKLEERCERAGDTNPQSCAIMSFMGEGYEKQDQSQLDFVMIGAITGSLPNPEIKGVTTAPFSKEETAVIDTGSIFFDEKDKERSKPQPGKTGKTSLFFK